MEQPVKKSLMNLPCRKQGHYYENILFCLKTSMLHSMKFWDTVQEN